MVARYMDALRVRWPVRRLAAHETRSHEGGIVALADRWSRLGRWLILGSERGTFYVSGQALTVENVDVVRDCLAIDPERTIRTIVEISVSGRAAKNDPAILALVIAMRDPDVTTRRLAASHLADVCRTGTHLLHAVGFVLATGGWNRVLRRAFAGWFTGRTTDALALQAIKYPRRDGVALADVLRLAHPKADDPVRDGIFKWIVDGEFGEKTAQATIAARDELHAAPTIARAIQVIVDHRLPREAVPTELLNHREVWQALLAEMPMMAMVRNLAKMTTVGLLTPDETNEATREVVARLTDAERIRRARVHPIALLAALKVYESGRGERGSLVWEPVPAIVTALDAAFYLAFQNVTPSGKRIRLALDVSASMDGNMVNGMPFLDARQASAAMALVTAATEPNHEFVAYSTELIDVTTRIRPSMRLDEVCRNLRAIPMGGTYCSLPIVDATASRTAIDAFVSYTDSETWDGASGRGGHHGSVADALRAYRQASGIAARHVVVAVTSNGFTLNDPDDPLGLDVAGFDAAAPATIADFIAGRI